MFLVSRKTLNNQASATDARPCVFLMVQNFERGGSERQFTVLARSLRPDIFRIRLGCIRAKGAFLDGMRDVAEFPLGGSFFGRKAHRSRLRLVRHIRTLGPAVAHSFEYYSNLMMIPMARLAGVPVIIGSHRQLGDLLPPLKRKAQIAVFWLCDFVVCNSRAAADYLIRHGLPAKKLVVIPNMLAESAFAVREPALPRSSGVLRVGMIARMNHAVKNHAAFLDAASRLMRRIPNTEFVLVGDGPLRASLEQTARRLRLGQQVVFMGDQQDIPAVLAALDVSVLPSLSESAANVVLESMAAGVPVVATRVGGSPELIQDGETGFLVPPSDPDRLVSAIETLLTRSELRREYGKRGREWARAQFSMEKVRDQYEQLYLTAIESKRSRRKSKAPFSGRSVDSFRPTRVTLVAASPRWIGGQGVQAELITRNLGGEKAADISFVPVDPELPSLLAWSRRIPYLRTLMRMPFFLLALWRGMRDAEIVHIFSASYWSFLLAPVPACLIARLRGKKTLINYHSGEAREHLSRWRTAVPVLRRADRLVVPSRYLVEVFKEFGLQAHVVPNAVDLDQFSYRPRQPLRPSLLCTRGFGRYYGVDVIVRAFARVKNEFPDAHLSLVGDGPLERQIMDLTRELKLVDVDFVGAVPHSEISRFYNQADIFINASWLDNMPVSILEAFASGTPVVSTAPEGIEYLVEHEHTGLLSAPGDCFALASNVMRALREPDLASRLAVNGYEKSRLFCWQAVRTQWLETYDSMRQQKG